MRWATLLLVVAVTSGCDAFADSSCTDVGGFNGIGVDIPEALFVAVGSVEFEVCDDEGCARAAKRLGRMPKDVSTPVGRGASVGFDDLGRDLGPGRVQVTVELYDEAHRLVARRAEPVTLSRYWPNGKDCDGDGWISGGLALSPGDAVAAAS